MKIQYLHENMTEKDNREFWDIVDIVGNAVNYCDGDLDDIRGEITHPYSDEDKFKVIFLSTTGKKGSRSFNYRVRKAVTEALKYTRFDDNIEVLSFQLDDNEIRDYVPRGLLRDFQKHNEMFEVEVTAYDDKSISSSFKDVLGEAAERPLYIIKDSKGNQLSAPNPDDEELWDRVASMEARGRRGLIVVAYTGKSLKEDKQPSVTLSYPNLTYEVVVDHIPATQYEPGDTVTETITEPFDFDIKFSDFVTYLAEEHFYDIFPEKEDYDMSDEEFSNYVKEHFDELYDRFERDILDYFEEQAIEYAEGHETYMQDREDDYWDSVSHERMERKWLGEKGDRKYMKINKDNNLVSESSQDGSSMYEAWDDMETMRDAYDAYLEHCAWNNIKPLSWKDWKNKYLYGDDVDMYESATELKESGKRFYVTIYSQDSVSGPEEGGYTSYGWEPYKSKYFRTVEEAKDFMDQWIKGSEIIQKDENRIHVRDDYDDEYIIALEHGGNRGRTEESPRTWAQAEFDAPNPRKYFDKSGRRIYNNPYADAKRAKELKALEKSVAERIESAATKEDIITILADSDYVKVYSKLRDKIKAKWDEIVGNNLNEDSEFKLSGNLIPIDISDDDVPNKKRAVLTQEVADSLEKFLRANRLWIDEFYFNSMNKTIEFDINWGDWKHEHMRAKWLIEDFFGDRNEFVRINSYATEEDGSDTYSAHYTLK